MTVVLTQGVPSAIVPALNVGTYATRSIYVTPAEFKAAPTGVDVSQLIPGGNPAQQIQALVMQLQRASAVADKMCRKVLAATVDTQAGSYRVQQDPVLGAVIKVPLDFTPIVAVSGVSVGTTPGALAPLTDLSNLWISRKTATIPVSGSGNGPVTTTLWTGRLYATVQYVNGWANTTLAAPAPSGAMSITVASPIGLMPGQQINVQNTTAAEVVTISPTWKPSNSSGAMVVPLASNVVGSYASGDAVTALPQEIKQAVILIAKSLIKTRGSESIVIASTTSQPEHVTGVESGVTSDMEMAEYLLADYMRAA